MMKHYKAFLFGVLVTALASTLFWAGTAYASTGCFTDTNGHPLETFICWMKDKGITTGFPDGSFKPDIGISRGQMAVFLMRSADVPPTVGDVYISTGPSNWVANGVYMPTAYVKPFWAFAQLKASAPGTYLYSISPALPSSLYNTKMYVKGIKLCYDATDTGAYITTVEGKHITYTSSGLGYSEWNTFLDPTDLTDLGCRVVNFSTAKSFWGSDQVTVNVYVTFTDVNATVRMGVTTVIISPSAEPAALFHEGWEEAPVNQPAVEDGTSGR